MSDNIVKNAFRDPTSGAVIFTDSSAAARARIQRKRAVAMRQKDAEIHELKNTVARLEFLVHQLIKDRS